MEDIRDGVCPLCRHNEVVECLLYGGVSFGQTTRLVSIALSFLVRKTLFNMSTGEPDLSQPLGRMVAYACAKCGYTQLFARNPSAVAADPSHGARVITGPKADGPYR